jgi:hypothetical protein
MEYAPAEPESVLAAAEPRKGVMGLSRDRPKASSY